VIAEFCIANENRLVDSLAALIFQLLFGVTGW
jgi:hypothetical protein